MIGSREMIIKGMIFAAGFGSRLGEIGRTVPKCLLEVTPSHRLIDYILERYAAIGVSEVVVNTHHLSELVKDYLASYPATFTIKVIHEPEILETGGGLLGAKALLEGADHVVLQNGDVYSECSLPAMLKAHCEEKNTATLLAQRRGSSRGFFFNQDRSLVGHLGESGGTPVKNFVSWFKGPEPEVLSFGGVSVISKSFWEPLSKFSGKFSITKAFLAAAERQGAVKAFDDSASRWADVGTVDKLEKLKSELKAGNF